MSDGTRLYCPQPTCGSPALDILESVPMTTHLSDGIIRLPSGDLDYHAYDSTSGDGGESVGVECTACRWSYEGDDWPDQLSTTPPVPTPQEG